MLDNLTLCLQRRHPTRDVITVTIKHQEEMARRSSYPERIKNQCLEGARYRAFVGAGGSLLSQVPSLSPPTSSGVYRHSGLYCLSPFSFFPYRPLSLFGWASQLPGAVTTADLLSHSGKSVLDSRNASL